MTHRSSRKVLLLILCFLRQNSTIRAKTIRAKTIRAKTIRAKTIRAKTIGAKTIRAKTIRAKMTIPPTSSGLLESTS